jgi:thiol:disulfide interchange protein DsbD
MAVRLFLQTISLTLVLGAAATAGPVPPSTGSSQNVRATLLSETSAVAPGKPFWLGLRLEMQPGWHVYWKQPGDSGLPPRVKWSLPAGFAADDLAFPYPQRFTEGTLATYGYTGDVLLMARIVPPASPPSGPAEISAAVSWLECREKCIPAKASLGLALPVAASPAPSREAALFRAARDLVPAPSAGWTFEAAADRIVLRPPARWRAPASAEFFGAQDNVIQFAAAQRVASGPRGWSLELARDPNGSVPQTLNGVLVARRGARVEAIEIEAAPRKETR